MPRASDKPNSDFAAPQVLESRARRKHPGFWIWLAPVVLAVACLEVVGIKDYKGAYSSARETEDAVAAAQRFVKENLGTGISSHFAPVDWTKVEREGDRYVVSGWLEAVPRSGIGSVSYDYTCAVSRSPDGDWFPAKVDLERQ